MKINGVFMNLQEANNYILEVTNIWMNGQSNQLEKYYAQNFEGHYYGEIIYFTNLVQRLNYMNLHQHHRKLELQDIIVNDTKIAIRFHYSTIDDTEGQFEADMMAIYYLNSENKIFKAWAYANKAVNYIR